MTVNERIKSLRKDHLKMNQTDFAALIGMKQTSVSSFEKSGATVTDQTIKSICNAVDGLNEEWLRDGIEPIFIEPETFSLDEYIRQRGGTDLEIEIVKTYFELDSDTRKLLVEHFKRHFMQASPAAAASDSEKDPEEMTVAEAEAIYKSSLSSAQKTGLSASSTTDGTKKKEA